MRPEALKTNSLGHSEHGMLPIGLMHPGAQESVPDDVASLSSHLKMSLALDQSVCPFLMSLTHIVPLLSL